MVTTPTVIEVTAGEIAEVLKRQGIGSDERVTLTIEPKEEIIPGRREARARVVAAGLTDADIDRLVKRAQKEVEPGIG
jgi:phosphopantothenate synthetase